MFPTLLRLIVLPFALGLWAVTFAALLAVAIGKRLCGVVILRR